MYKFLKVIHILGVAMFLGSIFAHIATGHVPGAADNPPAMLFARQAIELATRYVTLPGLVIAIPQRRADGCERLSGIVQAAVAGAARGSRCRDRRDNRRP